MDRALKGSERNLDLGSEVLAIAVNCRAVYVAPYQEVDRKVD